MAEIGGQHPPRVGTEHTISNYACYALPIGPRLTNGKVSEAV